MNIEEAKAVCDEFARKHGAIVAVSEIGFGRPCVAFAKGEPETELFVTYNPLDLESFRPIWVDPVLEAPDCAPNHYHKSDTMAVLYGEGYAESADAAMIELALWVKAWEALGELRIEEYSTGVRGPYRAMMIGEKGFGVRLTPTVNRITVRRVPMPACCANCQFNLWEENGPTCGHPAHWDDSDFEIDPDDGVLRYHGEETTDTGVIDWDNVCEHHLPGLGTAVNDPTCEAMTEAKRRRFDVARAALTAGKAAS